MQLAPPSLAGLFLTGSAICNSRSDSLVIDFPSRAAGHLLQFIVAEFRFALAGLRPNACRRLRRGFGFLRTIFLWRCHRALLNRLARGYQSRAWISVTPVTYDQDSHGSGQPPTGRDEALVPAYCRLGLPNLRTQLPFPGSQGQLLSPRLPRRHIGGPLAAKR